MESKFTFITVTERYIQFWAQLGKHIIFIFYHKYAVIMKCLFISS
jgi:hypothetical protein